MWPASISPYDAHVIALAGAEEIAERAAETLSSAGRSVLLDDRDARAGEKFADADLIGIPLRIVISERGLKEGTLEVRWRTDASAHNVSAATADEVVLAELEATRKASETIAEERRIARAAARGR